MNNYNRIYLFAGGKTSGSCGMLPYINLNDMEELPPIDKVHSIEIDIFYKDKLKESRLFFNWRSNEDKVYLRLMCYANDNRLKKQLKEKPDFLEKFVNFLISGNNEKILNTGIELLESDIPQNLISFIKQIKVWENFLDSFRENNSFNFRFGTAISSDKGYEGYYIFVIDAHHLRLPRKKDDFDVGNFHIYAAIDSVAVFDFNPKDNPPVIDNDGNSIWWPIHEKKIILLLPHSCTVPKIVEYYGYQESYKIFLAKKKQQEDREKEILNQIYENAEEKKSENEKIKNALRKSLIE